MTAFTSTIDPTKPAGSDLRSQGDDTIRALAQAVLDRFTALVVDPNDDAMALKANAVKASQLDDAMQVRTILQFSRVVAGGPVAAGLSATFGVAAVGAVVGDHVLAALSGPASAAAVEGCIIRGYVSATDTVTIHVYNTTAAGVTLNDTVLVSVIKAAAL